MSVDLTDYLIFGYVNIVRDMIRDCMSARKGRKEKKKCSGDRGFIITSSVVFRNYVPGELYALPLSITADCQGIQVNRFL